MKLIELIILGVFDAAVILWLAAAYTKYWEVINSTRDGYYWNSRANFTNAGIAGMLMLVINTIMLL